MANPSIKPYVLYARCYFDPLKFNGGCLTIFNARHHGLPHSYDVPIMTWSSQPLLYYDTTNKFSTFQIPKKINDILIIMWWLWSAHYHVACSNLHYIVYIFLTTMTMHIHGHTCIFAFYVCIWWWWWCGFSIYYFPSLFLSLLLTMSN